MISLAQDSEPSRANISFKINLGYYSCLITVSFQDSWTSEVKFKKLLSERLLVN